MDRTRKNKLFYGALILLGLWLGYTYLLPLLLPFLLGFLLALAAEPLVQLSSSKLGIKRSYSAGFGVLVTLALLTGFTLLLGSAAFREVTVLTGKLPDMQNTAKQGLGQLHRLLDTAVEKAPDNLRGLLQQIVNASFTDGTALMDRVSAQIPGALTGLLSAIPKGTLTAFTGILSAFMISARLPQLKASVNSWLPENWKENWLPALRHLRSGIWQWVKAQSKLAMVTWGVLGIGLTLLGVSYGILWGGLIALIDAVPILGTGAVLVPWAIISFLQGKTLMGLGLLAIYGIASLLRSVLEPRLVGKHLGLDPLLTLVCFYVCYRLFGFWGMVLSPFLAVILAKLKKSKFL